MKVLVLVVIVSIVMSVDAGKDSSRGSSQSSSSSHGSSGKRHKSDKNTNDLYCYVCKGVEDPLTCSGNPDNIRLCKHKFTQCATKKTEKDGAVKYNLGCAHQDYKPCLDQGERTKGDKTITTTCCDMNACNAGVELCAVEGGCGAGECRTDDITGLDYCFCGDVDGFPIGATTGPNCVDDVCGPNNNCELADMNCNPIIFPGTFGPYHECEDIEE